MIALDRDDIYLWRIALDASAGEVDRLASLLSPEERSQAEKMASEEQRVRFTTCRAAVRQILGMYLEKPAEEIVFSQTEGGNPRLLDSPSASELRFNVSQSQDLAVLAVAWNREIGVDIEAIRPVMEMNRIADRVLAPAERRTFRGCEEPKRLDLFFHYWTQKKAYVKAAGAKSRIPMDHVEVDFRAGTPVCLHAALGEESATERFTVCDFIPQNDFCGAFAVQGSELPNVRYRQWFNQL